MYWIQIQFSTKAIFVVRLPRLYTIAYSIDGPHDVECWKAYNGTWIVQLKTIFSARRITKITIILTYLKYFSTVQGSHRDSTKQNKDLSMLANGNSLNNPSSSSANKNVATESDTSKSGPYFDTQSSKNVCIMQHLVGWSRLCVDMYQHKYFTSGHGAARKNCLFEL